MTHRGPFQPPPFCDSHSVIQWSLRTQSWRYLHAQLGSHAVLGLSGIGLGQPSQLLVKFNPIPDKSRTHAKATHNT